SDILNNLKHKLSNEPKKPSSKKANSESISLAISLDNILKILSKTDKLSGREKALIELQQLQYDYADGYGHYGPTIAKLTDLLAKYKELYTYSDPLAESEMNKEIKENHEKILDEEFKRFLIQLFCFSLIYLIICILSLGGFWFGLFYLIAAIVLLIIGMMNEEDGMFVLIALCEIIPLFIVLVECFFGVEGFYLFSIEFHQLIQWFILICFLLWYFSERYSLAHKWNNENKSMNNRILYARKMTNDIKEMREELLKLKEPLYQEYDKVRNEYIHKYSEYLSDTEKENLCRDLPETFWWEIPREEVSSITINLRSVGTEADDADNYVRREATYFFATNYSALYPHIDQFKQKYLSIFNGCRINGVCYEVEYEQIIACEPVTYTTTHTENKYSGFKKALAMGSYMGLGNNLDQAFNNGEISSTEYQELRALYFAGGSKLDDKLNDTITIEETETYTPHDHKASNVGYIMLLNDPQNKGYALVDISGVYQHMEHIEETLHPRYVGGSYYGIAPFMPKIKITRILGDPVKRDPKIVAKMHFMREECR
ncbi:MAG: ABC transporter permease, partial [Erysipelotrichaceae bacterium]|nr:ABC transporter permease [Erysipelotrichaceae bacterium]